MRASPGLAADRTAGERWSWPAIAEPVGEVLDDAAIGSEDRAEPMLPA